MAEERHATGGFFLYRQLFRLRGDLVKFEARQRDYGQTPQGLMLCFQVLESWSAANTSRSRKAQAAYPSASRARP